MLIIDNDKCNGCGLCVQICHEHCIKLDHEEIEIDYRFCSTCTQCIAICIRQALSWDNSQPIEFDEKQLPTSLQLDELFKERRTVRDFKEDKIERKLLREIVEYGIYAPTHNFNMRVIVVDGNQIIEQVDKVIYNFNLRLYKFLYEPRIIHTLMKVISPNRKFEYFKTKPKLEKSLEWEEHLELFPQLLCL